MNNLIQPSIFHFNILIVYCEWVYICLILIFVDVILWFIFMMSLRWWKWLIILWLLMIAMSDLLRIEFVMMNLVMVALSTMIKLTYKLNRNILITKGDELIMLTKGSSMFLLLYKSLFFLLFSFISIHFCNCHAMHIQFLCLYLYCVLEDQLIFNWNKYVIP